MTAFPSPLVISRSRHAMWRALKTFTPAFSNSWSPTAARPAPTRWFSFRSTQESTIRSCWPKPAVAISSRPCSTISSPGGSIRRCPGCSSSMARRRSAKRSETPSVWPPPSSAARSTSGAGSLDHLAFRVDGLGQLRHFHKALRGYGGLPIDTVSHGNAWSVYFRDPEGNRLELFADTPWHVAQPVRFAIDLSLPDDELIQKTKAKIASFTDFQPAKQWFKGLAKRLPGDGV